MDPALLKQKEAFKKRALEATKTKKSRAIVEDVTRDAASASKPPKTSKKKKKKRSIIPLPSGASSTTGMPSQHFSDNPRRLLKAVIDTMKERYSLKNYVPLTFSQILTAIGRPALSEDLKQTLTNDLQNNTKLEYYSDDGSYIFKPTLGLYIRNRKQLLQRLIDNDSEGRGGVLLSEIKEAIYRPDKVMERLESDGDIIRITRQDKEEVVFYKNHDCELDTPISEEFKAHWHRASVDGMTDEDIEKYLQNVGIGAMGGESRKRKAPGGGDKKTKKRARNAKILNVHLDDTVLKDYSADS